MYRKEYSILRMCQALKVSPSSYYDYLSRSSDHADNPLERAVVAAFWRHKRRYGTRRLVPELVEEGYCIGRERIRRILKKNNLKAIQPKSFVPKTTQNDPRMRRSPNLLLDRDLPQEPDRVWVGDITYLPTADGDWLFLAIWVDIFSHFVVGWQVEDHLGEELIIKPFEKAIRRRRPKKGLIVHSDGGGQYGSNRFRAMLANLEFQQSMTRKDNHYDNAFAESFISRFKAELLEHGAFLSLEDARMECFDYIDAYYNTIRRHSSIGNKSPLQFEREYNRTKDKNESEDKAPT